MNQAEHDLDHARHALDDGDHDWACFAAQQSAEKALKGLFLHLGGEAWGHSLTRLLADLAPRVPVAQDLRDAARRLDRHYIPARCPNGFDAGAPHEYFSAAEAEEAIKDAEHLYNFCQQSLH